MIPKDIRELLERHLVDTSKLTHIVVDEEYWLVFNMLNMNGFEIRGDLQSKYYINMWSTTDPSLKRYLKRSKYVKAIT